jgi:hypothetical protein
MAWSSEKRSARQNIDNHVIDLLSELQLMPNIFFIQKVSPLEYQRSFWYLCIKVLTNVQGIYPSETCSMCRCYDRNIVTI